MRNCAELCVRSARVCYAALAQSAEEALPILRAVENAQDQNLISTHAIDHEPSIEGKDDWNATQFPKLRRGYFADHACTRKCAEQSRCLEDGGEKAISDCETCLAGEAVPSAIDLTKSCC